MDKNLEILKEQKYWNVFKTKLQETAWKDYQGKKVRNENKKVLEIVLENTRRSILNEGITTSANASVVVPVILGLVKKFFPKLIANEIVSVQPMTKPTSIVKFKKLYFGDEELASHRTDGLLDEEISKGNPSYEFRSLVQSVNTTIEAGRSAEVLLSGVKYPFSTIQKGSVNITFSGVTKAEVNNVVDFDTVVFEIKHATGKVVIKNMGSSSVSVSAQIRYNVTAFETNYDEAISRVRYEIENIPVVAETRKLKVGWSYEFLEDVQAELGDMLNFEEEVFNDISALIAAEINREILTDIIQGAMSVGHVLTWEYKPPTATNFLTAEAYYRTLLNIINEMSGKITRATKRFEPNFIVISPFMKQVLVNGLTQYEYVSTQKESVDYSQVGFVHAISGRYDIYVTPSIPDNKIIVGYKGSSVVDSGYVFAPYIPLKAVSIHHETTQGLLFYTRNGKQMYAPWYYGVIDVQM